MQSAAKILEAVERARAEVRGTLYVAVSGGVDSMVLLESLLRTSVAAVRPTPIVVLHVNHNLRGTESEADAALVSARAEELGVPFFSETLEWQGEKPSQARCRDRRRAFLQSKLGHPDDRIFLAHHLDDQAETIFLRLYRGAGLRGLGGMAYAAGPYVRPLLHVTKEEILEAASEWNVPWREDASNSSLNYERNWLRSEIFPLLEKRRPGFSVRLAALADEAREATRAHEEAWAPYDGGHGWSLARAEELRSLRGSTLARAYGLSRRHVEGLRQLLEKRSGKYEAEGVRFHLSAGVVLAEREGRFAGQLALQGNSQGLRAESCLGTWTLPLGFAVAKPAGEKAKKAFQTRKVPIFLRGAIPLAKSQGRPEVLLPKEGEAPETYEYQPSPLALWWLTPCARSGGQADAPARE